MGIRITGIISLVLFLLLSTAQSYSQEEGSFSMGAGIGLNITNVSGTNDLPTKEDIKSFNLTGIRIYSLLGIKLSNNLVLLIEPGYEQKGYKLADLTLDSTVTIDTALWTISGDLLYLTNYFTVPVTLNFTTGRRFRLNIGAGGYIGFMVDSKLRINADQQGVDPSDLDYSTRYHSMDYGLIARASLEIKLMRFLSLEVGTSYALGLAQLNTNEYFSDANLKNRSIFAGAGIRLYLAGGGSAEK